MDSFNRHSFQSGKGTTAAIVLTLAWATLAFGGVYPWAYAPLLVACAGVGLVLLLRNGGGRRRLANHAPVWMAAIAGGAVLQLVPLPGWLLATISPGTGAFFRAYTLGGHAAAGIGAPWRPLSLDPAATWVGLAFLVSFGLFLAGLMRSLSPSQTRSFVRSLIVLALLLAVIGIAQKALAPGDKRVVEIYGFWRPRHFGDVFGPFVNRNHFGGWMLMVLPLALAHFAAVLEEALRRVGPGWRNRLLWLGSDRAGQSIALAFSIVVMVVALVYSGSRSGLACALAGVLLVGWLAVRRQVRFSSQVLIGAMFVAFLAGAVMWAGPDRLWQRMTPEPRLLGERLDAWNDACRIIRDFPVAGTGLNTYATATLVYQTRGSWHYQQAHNDYLQLAAEGGLLLAVPALLAVVSLVRHIRRRWRQALDDPDTRWLRAGAVVSLVCIALQSLVEFSLQIPANAVLFTIVAAIAVHSPRHSASRSQRHRVASHPTDSLFSGPAG